MKTIKNKITTFHWGLQPNFISFKKLSKRLFSNFICFIINNEFYINSLWMHYMLLNSVFGRIKLSISLNFWKSLNSKRLFFTSKIMLLFFLYFFLFFCLSIFIFIILMSQRFILICLAKKLFKHFWKKIF